jgi:YVTN family beta-propeller protein
MQSKRSKERLGSRGFAALCAALALAMALSTLRAGAAPFAYVSNYGEHADGSTVSVIDTATNTVVATVTVGTGPIGVAVTPDGKHVYVTNQGGGHSNTVSVIETATDTVVATVTVGGCPERCRRRPGRKTRLCHG